MKTIIHTKIYGIQESAKGWKGMYAYYFHKEHAETALKECNEWKKANNSKVNFRLVELLCMDSIGYTTE